MCIRDRPWPDAMLLATRAASGLYHYIEFQGLEGSALHQTYLRLLDALQTGVDGAEFRSAQAEIRRQLDQLVQAELGSRSG